MVPEPSRVYTHGFRPSVLSNILLLFLQPAAVLRIDVLDDLNSGKSVASLSKKTGSGSAKIQDLFLANSTKEIIDRANFLFLL
jgi:hypothetical protein